MGMNTRGRSTGRGRSSWRWVASAAVGLALVGAAAFPAAATEWRLGGELGHYFFYGTDTSRVLQNEARYSLSVEARPGWEGRILVRVRGAAATGASEPSVLFQPPPAEARPELDEAYVDVYLPSADLRVGRQVVAWGTADAVNPTDVVNPRPLGLDALLDRAVRRLPVPAVRVAYYPRPDVGATVVGVADFVAAPLPTEALRGEVQKRLEQTGTGAALADEWLSTAQPGPDERYELAVRLETRVRGYDVYLSYFSGLEDLPALWVEPVAFAPELVVRVRGEYRRQQQFGLAVAGTVGDIGVWLEAAYAVPERLAVLEQAGTLSVPAALSTNEPSWQAVAGADRTFSSGLHLSGGLVGMRGRTLSSPYPDPSTGEATSVYTVGTVRYAPSGSSAEWDATVVASARDGSLLFSPGFTYELAPNLRWALRGLVASGQPSSEFGALASAVRGVGSRLVWSF